jgi:dTDP-4-dehydrorhamnose reductase
MRVLVVGGHGLLGANVAVAARKRHDVWVHSRGGLWPEISHKRAHLDLTATGEIPCMIKRVRPDLVLNCSGLVDIERCESDPELAYLLNAAVPQVLAESCRVNGARFVHVSTDAVFRGDGSPTACDSSTSPMNTYGETKALGESRVVDTNPMALVLRTCIVGLSPSGNRSLAEYFLNRLTSRRVASGYTDVFFRPILASGFWSIVEYLTQQETTGVHNAFSTHRITKGDFGLAIARALQVPEEKVHLQLYAESPLSIQRGLDANAHPCSLLRDHDVCLLTPDDQARLITHQWWGKNRRVAARVEGR